MNTIIAYQLNDSTHIWEDADNRGWVTDFIWLKHGTKKIFGKTLQKGDLPIVAKWIIKRK